MSAEGSHKPIYQKHSCVPGFSEQSRIVGPYIDHLERFTALVPHERRGYIQMTEDVQKSVTRKIKYARKVDDFWDHLNSLRNFSLKRSLKRYRIINARKILEYIVPSFSTKGIKFVVSPQCVQISSTLYHSRSGTFQMLTFRSLQAETR